MRLRATRLTAIATAVRRLFNPSELFATGAPGVWYDLSLTDGTLFQDAAGTTPVTAVEQPVGLVLDKSKGLVLGSEKILNGDGTSLTGWTNGNNWWSVSGGRFYHASSSVYNELAQTLTTISGFAIVEFDVQVVSATNTCQWFYINAAGAGQVRYLNKGSYKVKTIVSDRIQKIGFSRASGSTGEFYVDNISVRELPGNHAFQTTSANRPILSARINQFVGTETLATQSLATLAATYLLRFEGTGSITLSGTATGTYTAGVYSVTCTAGTLTATVAGSVTKADLRVANDGVNLPPYQRVNTATDYDTVGFPLYLRFNGSAQSLQTNSIDFSGTDKVLVAAGVRKLSDSTFSVLLELSTESGANSGVFGMFYPVGTDIPQPGFRSGGSTRQLAYPASGYIAPVTNVLSGVGDISGDQAILRVNGAQVATNTADQGTGNLGFHPLYIGARAGTSLFFNGRLYSLIIAGIKPTDAQILGVETYINRLTRAF